MTTTLELHPGDPRLAELLELGRVPGDLAHVALLRGERDGVVQFELAATESLARPSAARVWWRAIRAISLTATATPCLAAVLLTGARLRPVLAICAALGALILQIGVNLHNDAEDHRRLIDQPGTLGGAGVIQRGWLSARQVRRAGHACLGLGLLLGLPALLAYPLPMLAIGAGAALGAAGYSGRPFSLKYRALGDLAVVALCGPLLTVGMAIAASGEASLAIALVGAAFGLLAVAILHVNNLQDIDDDRRRGAITVASRLGPRAGKTYLVLLYGLGGVAWIVGASLAQLPWWVTLAPALSLPLLVGLLGDVLPATDLKAPPLAMIRVRAAQVHLAFGVTACVAMGVARALG